MASTDAKPTPQKNVAYRCTFPILDADGDLVTGATSPDSEISKDGGTFVDCTNEATEIATASGMYFLDLTSTEMNADTVAVIVKSGTGKTTPIVMYPEEAGDIRVNVSAWNGTAVASPHTAGYPVVTIKDGTGTGEIDTTSGGVLVAAIAANAITAAAIAADAIGAAEIADGAIDAATFAAGAINAAAIATDAIGAAELAADAVTEIQAGLATAAALVTAQADLDNIQTRLPAALVSGRMDSDVGAIQSGAITAAAIATDAIGSAELAATAVAEIADAVWDELIAGHAISGSTGEALAAAGAAGDPWTTALPGAYGAGTAGQIVGDNLDAAVSSRATAAALATVQADTDDLQTRLPAALVSGRMDASVGAVATDAIDAGALAADAVEEIADGLLDRDLSAGTDSGTEILRTVRQALRALRNRFSISGTTRNVYKENDMTVSWTSTLQTDAAADPIVGDDPTGP